MSAYTNEIPSGLLDRFGIPSRAAVVRRPDREPGDRQPRGRHRRAGGRPAMDAARARHRPHAEALRCIPRSSSRPGFAAGVATVAVVARRSRLWRRVSPQLREDKALHAERIADLDDTELVHKVESVVFRDPPAEGQGQHQRRERQGLPARPGRRARHDRARREGGARCRGRRDRREPPPPARHAGPAPEGRRAAQGLTRARSPPGPTAARAGRRPRPRRLGPEALRPHAPRALDAELANRVNGDPAVDVPLTDTGREEARHSATRSPTCRSNSWCTRASGARARPPRSRWAAGASRSTRSRCSTTSRRRPRGAAHRRLPGLEARAHARRPLPRRREPRRGRAALRAGVPGAGRPRRSRRCWSSATRSRCATR